MRVAQRRLESDQPPCILLELTPGEYAATLSRSSDAHKTTALQIRPSSGICRGFSASLLPCIHRDGDLPAREIELLALLRWFRVVSVSTISRRSDQHFPPIVSRA